MAMDFGMVLPFFVGLYAYVGSWLPWWWVWVHCGFMVVAMDFGIGFDFFLGFCAFTGSVVAKGGCCGSGGGFVVVEVDFRMGFAFWI